MLGPQLLAGRVPSQVRLMVRSGAADLGLPGWDPDFGDGRLDAYGAVTAAVPDPAQIELFQPGNGGIITSGSVPFGFGWSRVAGAASYAMQVKTPAGGTVTLTGITDNFYYPAQQVWNGAAAGTYSWRAGALDSNGQVISVSSWWDFTK